MSKPPPRKRSTTNAQQSNSTAINIGEIADRDFDLREKTHEFQKEMLGPFVKFFIRVNMIVLLTVGIIAVCETIMVWHQLNVQRIVTDKVLIAAIGSIAIQTAAIIIAAFKGLFSVSSKK